MFIYRRLQEAVLGHLRKDFLEANLIEEKKLFLLSLRLFQLKKILRLHQKAFDDMTLMSLMNINDCC